MKLTLVFLLLLALGSPLAAHAVVSGTTLVRGAASAGLKLGAVGDFNGDGTNDFMACNPRYTRPASSGCTAMTDNDVATASDSDDPTCDGVQTGGIAIFTSATGSNFSNADIIITGENESDSFGTACANASDVNGDGIDDIVVGATGYDNGTGAVGAAYVIYGSSTLASAAVDDAVTAASAVRFTGTNDSDLIGNSVAAAGDIDGDGYEDVIVGASDYGSSNNGAAYVLFGSASLASAEMGNAVGIQFSGTTSEAMGYSVAGIGDVDGDNKNDVLIGAYNYGSAKGRAYLALGSGMTHPSSGMTSVSLATTSPSWVLTYTGENNSDRAGYSVGPAGDVNGDGYADFVVGAPGYDASSTSRDNGAVYILRGSASPASQALSSTSSSAATPMTRVVGANASDSFGYAVSGGFDFNNNGYDDVLVGATGHDTSTASNVGIAYVLLGSAAPSSFTLTSTTSGSLARRYPGANAQDAAGAYVGVVGGDVNADGYEDFIVGTSGYDSPSSNSGKVEVRKGAR